MYSLYSGENIIKSIILFLIGGFSVYYFVILILQYYILLPKLQIYGGGYKCLIFSAIISLSCMIIIFYLTNVVNLSIHLVIHAGSFLVWIVFFVLGIYLGKNKIKLSRKKMILFAIFGLTLSVAETYFQIWYSNSFSGLGIKTGAFVYSFAAILFFFL